ncbi:MAG: hypothetical protein AMQ22_01421 [Candidatus Methanofastidiosum methylothiophilum]|uniref:Uncharacterized protein n=1 Tax=Candidatus Methanofastidiosum methylothiophilum TaxID=1705564 RepID=A0A150J0P8_9EURY|nr:MAG: hypothetical protein AMQ22_01421 [Candidatus Methanofastidiosum methylthiophilus]
MKKIISVFLLLAFLLSLVPNYSAQELPGRDFFIDEKGNPQALIVLSEAATAKDIQRVAEVVTKLTNETYYSVTGTDEKIIWESGNFTEDNHDNVALGYTGVKSNLDYGYNWRRFTTPAYFFSHGGDPAPAYPFCPFYTESVEAFFDGDRSTRIVGRNNIDWWNDWPGSKNVIVKFNDYKEISDVNFTFENLTDYEVYYLSSYCPNSFGFHTYGNWQLLPVVGGWPRAGSAPKITDSFSLTQSVTTNALLIVLDPTFPNMPPNPALPHSLYEFEVRGKSFSVLYGNSYYVDFTWATKTLGQDKNLLKNLDYWIEDIKETLPGDFIQTGGKSYSVQTSSYNLLDRQINLLRMYKYNEDETFPDKAVGRIFYGTPRTWENEEFKVGQTKVYGNYKVKLVDINWDKTQTTVNFDHKTGKDYLGEKKVTVEVTDPDGIVKWHIMTVDCCDNTLAELFVDTQAESDAATKAICRLKTEGYLCDITPIIFHSNMSESAIDPLYNNLARDHFGSGSYGFWPYIYGYGYDYNAALNYPTLIFNGDKSRAIQRIPPDTEEAYYEAFKAAYESNVSSCCDAKIIINTNMDPERFTTATDKEALVTVRLNKDFPNTELYLNVWGITCDCCAPVATGRIDSQYWQNINRWTIDCSEKVLDYNWKDLRNGDVYRTEINLCGTNYCGMVAFLQDKNTGKIYGSAIRHFTPSPSANLSPDIASSDCQCVIEYNKDLDCDNYREEVEFAIEGADVAFIGMEHDLEKNIDGEIKKHMLARFNIYTLIDYGCIDDCDCNYIQNDGSRWKLRFLMNDQNLYSPWVDRCVDCSKDKRSIKIELCEPIPFDCLKEGVVFWGPDRYFRVYVEDYDEEKYYVKYKIQRVDLVPKKETVNVKVEPTNLIRTDKQITVSDRAKYNMILIGNKDNNEEIKRIYDIGNFNDSEGMIYLKDIYGKKDILILNAANISDLNEPIKQLSYLLDMIL